MRERGHRVSRRRWSPGQCAPKESPRSVGAVPARTAGHRGLRRRKSAAKLPRPAAKPSQGACRWPLSLCLLFRGNPPDHAAAGPLVPHAAQYARKKRWLPAAARAPQCQQSPDAAPSYSCVYRRRPGLPFVCLERGSDLQHSGPEGFLPEREVLLRASSPQVYPEGFFHKLAFEPRVERGALLPIEIAITRAPVDFAIGDQEENLAGRAIG